MDRKTKSKLSKRFVTEGELMKDVRDLLLLNLPRLAKKRPIWIRVWPYATGVFIFSLFLVDYGRPAKSDADVFIARDAEVTIVKMPQPDWNKYGLNPRPGYWHVPNPAGRSAHVFDVTLTAQTLTYKRTTIRALAQDLAGEARLDFLDPPLVVKYPTILLVTPADMDPKDLTVREAVVRTCALQFGDKQVPLHTFVDPNTFHGKLVIEIVPRRGRGLFDANLNLAFTRLVRLLTPLLSP